MTIHDSEDPTLHSNLYHAQNDGKEESLPITSTAQTETGGDYYRVSEPTSDSQPISAGNPYCSAAQE